MRRPPVLSLRAALLPAALLASRAAFAGAAAGDTEQRFSALQSDQAHAGTVAVPLGRARQSLDRAAALDRAGDARHAATARAAAREWLDAAVDLIRATDAEQRATGSERKLDDLETKVLRERALLEETVARRGRATQALEQLRHEPPAEVAPPATTKTAVTKVDPKSPPTTRKKPASTPPASTPPAASGAAPLSTPATKPASTPHD